MTHRNRNRNGAKSAALPMRWDGKGTLYVLMVTSRGSGRWVMPRGWLMDRTKPWKTAEIEALDAAGAVGHVGPNPIGRYVETHRSVDGAVEIVEIEVFPMVVERLRSDWRDRHVRRRRWFEAAVASLEVEEKGLSELLLRLAQKPAKRTALGRFLSGL